MKGERSVGLEFRIGFPQEGTGIARYRDNLRAAVVHMGADVTILSEGAPPLMMGEEFACAHVGLQIQPHLFSRAQRRFTLTGRLTRVKMAKPPRIFHWSHPMPLFVEGAENIYTVHDLIPLHHPELTGVRPARMERLLRTLVSAGARFTAVSETTRNEVLELLPDLGERLSCTYESVPFEDAFDDAPSTIPREGYFIAIGRIEPRKNIRRLVTAWEQAGTGRALVLVGPDGEGEGMDELRQWLQGRNIIRYPWLPRPQMLNLMVHARAFLMPSLAEGFGLSAIEAMALGVPAMVSKYGAAKEIAGEAALAIDPLDVSDIAAGIMNLGSNDILRETLIARGRMRAGAFSQANFIERLEACYAGKPDTLGLPSVIEEELRACAS